MLFFCVSYPHVFGGGILLCKKFQSLNLTTEEVPPYLASRLDRRSFTLKTPYKTIYIYIYICIHTFLNVSGVANASDSEKQHLTFRFLF